MDLHAEAIALIREAQANAGTSGFNEYGVPMHACNGYRQDEHYWARLQHRREQPLRDLARLSEDMGEVK